MKLTEQALNIFKHSLVDYHLLDNVEAVSKNTFQKNSIEPIAEIIDFDNFSHEPQWFTTAPAASIKNLLKKKLSKTA